MFIIIAVFVIFVAVVIYSIAVVMTAHHLDVAVVMGVSEAR